MPEKFWEYWVRVAYNVKWALKRHLLLVLAHQWFDSLITTKNVLLTYLVHLELSIEDLMEEIKGVELEKHGSENRKLSVYMASFTFSLSENSEAIKIIQHFTPEHPGNCWTLSMKKVIDEIWPVVLKIIKYANRESSLKWDILAFYFSEFSNEVKKNLTSVLFSSFANFFLHKFKNAAENDHRKIQTVSFEENQSELFGLFGPISILIKTQTPNFTLGRDAFNTFTI